MNEEKEILNKIKECVDNIKDLLEKSKEYDSNIDSYLKNNLDANDYEYVKALINGEKPKNNPNNLDKINVLKPFIVNLCFSNIIEKNYLDEFGGFILTDELAPDKNLSKKLK